MRCGIIVGVLCATLTLGAGCVGSQPRWEYASWQVDDAHVVEAQPEAAYPAESLGGPLAAADGVGMGGAQIALIAAAVVTLIVVVAVVDWEDEDPYDPYYY